MIKTTATLLQRLLRVYIILLINILYCSSEEKNCSSVCQRVAV
jgi:hypothetical protein